MRQREHLSGGEMERKIRSKFYNRVYQACTQDCFERTKLGHMVNKDQVTGYKGVLSGNH